MNEEEARRLLLVRAVESEDGAEALLTREDRQQASAAALGGDRGDEGFLVRRAQFAFARLETRFPQVGRADRAARWPGWIDWAMPAAALVLGVLGNELDSGNRLNIIAFPLAGMIAWNLAVYLLLAIGGLRRLAGGSTAKRGFIARLIERVAAPRTGSSGQPIGRALARFAADWTHYAGRLNRARVRRVLHLSAAALAAGVLLGMYGRALAIEYRAGWESTFIGAGTLHDLLSLVLAPASALTGIALPGPDRLEALRWSNGIGENAGPWIHLYAVTAILFIIGPRLALAALATARAARQRRRMPAPGPEDFYIRRLLRGARGGGASVRIVPYSNHPDADAQRRLRSLLTRALGEGTEAAFDPPIPYGGEDEWLGAAQLGGEIDHLIILFGLSATPEAENHGALVAGVKRRLAAQRSGAGLAVLLDETSYRQRLGGQAGADDRLRARRLAWERMLADAQVAPLAIDLAEADEAALAARLESALIRDPALLSHGRTA